VLHRYDAAAERVPRETDLFRPPDGHTVLFAYDGSAQAKTAILEAAHRLGPNRYAIVLTVWQPVASPDRVQGVQAAATRVAYEGARLARSIGFEARPIVASGDPVWRGIVDCADSHDASFVVLGSRGSGGPALTSMGGVAAAVARHTKRPVLIMGAGSAKRAANTTQPTRIS
jgi:nucleotide-binding universal stress UspA family protein